MCHSLPSVVNWNSNGADKAADSVKPSATPYSSAPASRRLSSAANSATSLRISSSMDDASSMVSVTQVIVSTRK